MTFSLENKGFRVLKNKKWSILIFSLENKGFRVLNNEKKIVFPSFLKSFSLENKEFEVPKNQKRLPNFENLGKLSWIVRLEIIWNIHCNHFDKKGQIYFLVQEVSSGCGRWPK